MRRGGTGKPSSRRAWPAQPGGAGAPPRSARPRLSLPALCEMFLQRGIVVSHEAVRDWEAKLAPVLAGELRRRRHGKGGARSRHWHVDEADLEGRGRGGGG